MTNVGTDFWIAFPPNWSNQGYPSIHISSNFSTSGTIHSAFPGVDQNFTVVPGTVTELSIPMAVGLVIGIENKGIRVTSVDPVSVYGLSYEPASTDAFMALPVNALGTDYRVMSYNTHGHGRSQFSVIATQDNTTVTIFNHWTNSTNTITLNQGQTYINNDNPAPDQDITGSRIQSDHPVAVYGSSDCIYIPDNSCDACDHIVEEMFPSYEWGKNFVTIALAGRDNSGDRFRIMASEDNTYITINGVINYTLNAGDYYEINLAGYSSITSTRPVMVAQFAKGELCTGNTKGDPLMMLIPPTEQFLMNYTIINLGPFVSSWVNIASPDYALGTIYQDGTLIPASAFTQIGTTSFWGAQLSVNAGSHTFTSTNPFGVFVYGWNSVNSYGYPGGCAVSPVATVKSVTLAPDTSYGQLNVTTVCLTATVKDSLQNPVGGVLVTFHVSGLGPLTGNAYTDSLGHAVYCYSRTGTTPGTDQVYAEVSSILSNTVLVFWSIGPPCINPSDGGLIGSAQTGCAGFIPSPLVNLVFPSGQIGNLGYKWQFSVTDSISGFQDIPASDTSTYTPGSISQTTWFKRLSRVDCKADWSDATGSNVLKIGVTTPLPVSIVISAADTIVCTGTSVTFTAVPANGGTVPHYQWQINGGIAGTDSSGFTYIPSDGDQVKCILTSNALCIVNNPDTSNTITMTVATLLQAGVSISASLNPFCFGSPDTITASPVNGGSSPNYQWLVNGSGAGSNLPYFIYIPSENDNVLCTMTSSLTCLIKPEVSDSIVLTAGNQVKVVDTTICYGSSYYAGGKWQSVPGTYTDTLAIPANCMHYVETHLSFKPKIPLDLGSDTTLCGKDMILDATVPGSSTYLWQDGSTDSIYPVSVPGIYKVSVIYDNCQASDSVRVRPCNGSIFLPDAFTPNGDGLNDTFRPVGIEPLVILCYCPSF
jgi:hypothetical protein